MIHNLSPAQTLKTAINTALTSKYTDPEKYHQYVLSRGRDRLAKDIAAIAHKYANEAKRPTALDLGAGTGIISAALQGQGFTVTATDADAAMVKALQAKLPNVTTQQQDFNQPFTLKDNTFDIVTTVWANRYLSRPGLQNFISEIQRVLKPGGVFVWPLFPADRVLWKIRAGLEQPTSAAALAKRLEAVGFTDIVIDREHKQQNRQTKNIANWTYPVYIIARKSL